MRVGLVALALIVTVASLGAQDREQIVKGKQGQAIDALLVRCEAFGFDGVVLVQKKGKSILRKGYGEARPGVPNSTETLYDLGSASKQVTATAILKLVIEGQLALDDSIAEHLPGVPPDHAGVTIHHLLTHTSGCAPRGPAGSDDDLELAVGTYLGGTRGSEPGTRFEYWSGGYSLLAAIVERVSGEPFEDFVQRELFARAKLVRTVFIETAGVAEDDLAASPAGERLVTEHLKGWGYRGAGGVLTSVGDVSLWMGALDGKQLLNERSLGVLFEPKLGSYACGWYVYAKAQKRRIRQHGGDALGCSTMIRAYGENDVLLVVLTRTTGAALPVTDLIAETLLGETARATAPPEVDEWSPKQRERFLGTFGAEAVELVVTERGTSFVCEFRGVRVLDELRREGGTGYEAERHRWVVAPVGKERLSSFDFKPDARLAIRAGENDDELLVLTPRGEITVRRRGK